MRKITIYYFLVFISVFNACEDIYTPDIEKRENVIVVDAIIVEGQDENYIRLNESKSFADRDDFYPAIEGSSVSIIDNNDIDFVLPEVEKGVFHVNIKLSPDTEYKLRINYNGNTYESNFESFPEEPDIDSLYGIKELKVILEGGESSIDDYEMKRGVQTYCDIGSIKKSSYYRFSARKVLQYFTVLLDEAGEDSTIYKWKSFFPTETYNIAAALEYSNSTDIKNHPLFFFDSGTPLETDHYTANWILILKQFGLSQTAYNYYKDLNNQLNSEGRLFDPLYVQARSNLKCINDPNQLILGNFELSTFKEYRYFVRYISKEKGYTFRPIPYFYEISLRGEQSIIYPDFWEWTTKTYPDE